MEKQDVVCPCRGISFGHEKEGGSGTGHAVDEPQKRAEGTEPAQRTVLCDSTWTRVLEKGSPQRQKGKGGW